MTAFGLRSRVGTGIGSWLGDGLGVTTFGAFESIATITVGTATPYVTFSDIPQTYKHLQFRIMARTTRSGALATLSFKFNADAGANYSVHNLTGEGTAASSSGYASVAADYTMACRPGAAGSAANLFGVSIFDVLDYTNTNKYTTTRTLTGVDQNGTGGYLYFSSGNWRNSAAITEVSFFDSSFNNVAVGSHFALYGIKG